MKVFRHFDALPDDLLGSAVAIGNFDGVHRGHQAVIGEAGRIARADNLPWAVLTFEPHPRSVFNPSGEAFRLTPFRAKAKLIEGLGVDALIVQHFDNEFSQKPAETFVEEVLVNSLKARHVISGYDFMFGKGRKGDCDLLLHMGKDYGYDFTAVSAQVDEGGEQYSSTRVRNALMAGNVKAATKLLSRPYEILGVVEHGDKRGRTIGFPTANIAIEEQIKPRHGVYAIRACFDNRDGADEAWLPGVANFGSRPTVGGDNVLLETNLFDFDEDIYGQHMRVQLIDFIRPEQKFDSLEALKKQIEADSQKAREILSII